MHFSVKDQCIHHTTRHTKGERGKVASPSKFDVFLWTSDGVSHGYDVLGGDAGDGKTQQGWFTVRRQPLLSRLPIGLKQAERMHAALPDRLHPVSSAEAISPSRKFAHLRLK
ncbi:MAG: hypothetical protein H0U76_00110 [Ktedonobacteraceae bacterium]|nr:hypothetical protein [Ktedonobacteraceae bacterium]